MNRRIKLSIQHLWAATVIVGIFIFVSTHPIRPQDFWWHMAIGREVLSTGHIPLVDRYSYTMAGEPYPAYQIYWLMEVILYAVFRAGGGELVVFFQSLIITGAYGIIMWLCYSVSKSWRIAAFSTLFAAALGLNDWNIRPQAITFLLGASILLAIHRFRLSKNKAWLWIFPIVMTLWANSHGTFALGLAMIGVWWLDETWLFIRKKGDWKQTIIFPTLAGIIATLGCLLTPQGLGIVKYLRAMTVSPVIQNLVTEWAAPSFAQLGGRIFIIGLMICASLLAISPKRPSLFQITLFILFGLLGLKTMRGAVWFGIVMAPILAEHLESIRSVYLPGKQEDVSTVGSAWMNRILLVFLLMMIVVSLPWFKQYLPLPPMKAGIYSGETPFMATEFLVSEKLPNPLFNSMSFGSYLIWKADGLYPVFIDPRIDLYSAALILEYMAVSSGDENWQDTLERYEVKTILASPVEQLGLIEKLDHSPLWERVYADEAAVIYTHK